jgi:hypothetical protein
VQGGEVLGHAQRMPHADDVEHHADADALGAFREDGAEHQPVRNDLVALVLEVVLGEPERVEADRVGQHPHVEDPFGRSPDLFGTVAALSGRGRTGARVGHFHTTEEKHASSHNEQP